MKIRKTKAEDLERVLQIYEDARTFMRENGNPTQWGDTEPREERVGQDIADGDSYVCVVGAEIVGVFFFKVMEEPNYAVVYSGAWKDESPYGVIHRVAADSSKHGIASFCIKWALAQSGGHLRIDTHENNLVMQKVLKKHGFEYCGNIIVQDGTKRLAYELTREGSS